MRLVNADSAEKEAKRLGNLYLAQIRENHGTEMHRAFEMKELFRAMEFILHRLPTVDAVEVVRCKDCRFCMQSQVLRQHRCYCPQKSSHVVEDNGYCSFGVRKS